MPTPRIELGRLAFVDASHDQGEQKQDPRRPPDWGRHFDARP
jgi:hypothetical protein